MKWNNIFILIRLLHHKLMIQYKAAKAVILVTTTKISIIVQQTSPAATIATATVLATRICAHWSNLLWNISNSNFFLLIINNLISTTYSTYSVIIPKISPLITSSNLGADQVNSKWHLIRWCLGATDLWSFLILISIKKT